VTEVINIPLEEVHKLAISALSCQGFSSEQANAIANTVCAAERDECYSHGLFRIPFYIKAAANPSTDASAVPLVSVNESSVVHVDAQDGFCPFALEVGLQPLIEKTRSNGIAALAIHKVYNIAALWPEVEALANEGLVAFAFTGANAFVAPHGGVKPIFGTNPMAFSWPRLHKPPLVFDQASSVSARGEIQLHGIAGKTIPDGWAIDADGNPTNDPEAALQGAQLPFGGHKGSSIALMVELLAGALIGDLFSYESSAKDTLKVGAPFGGEFIIAIDPARTLSDGNTEAAQQRAEQLFEKILEQEGTRLPSSRRYEARQRTAVSGINI
ncbi:UNVERIFIED_CONTAM: hypothetical protein GTU68_026258, partial [Idotea baltica]|nr:hypothetical protein [Idotea baltica]